MHLLKKYLRVTRTQWPSPYALERWRASLGIEDFTEYRLL